MTSRQVDDGDGHMDEIDSNEDPESDRYRFQLGADGIVRMPGADLSRLLEAFAALRKREAAAQQRAEEAKRAADRKLVELARADLIGRAHDILRDMPQEGHRAAAVAEWLALYQDAFR